MESRRDSASSPETLFAEAVAIMARLRAPGGCPWDREQTFDSIKPYTLEEAYEVFDAIERRHWQDLCDELGDLLLQVLFYAEMAKEAGHFGIGDVIAGLNRKLVRRHPHVFGEETVGTPGVDLSGGEIDSARVLRNWDAIKEMEKEDLPKPASILDAVPRALPALIEARKLGSRASKVGFDWSDLQGVFDKLHEETGELHETIAAHAVTSGELASNAASEEVVSEVGDLLFTAVHLARHLKVDPEFALRRTNAKFRRRFATMEATATAPLQSLSAVELDDLWNRAKENQVTDLPVSAPLP